MATTFERIKNVDQNTIDLVNGYIRDKQSLLPYEDNPYYVISSLVIHLILSFYFDPEYFATIQGHIKASNNNKIISMNGTAYGNITVPSTIPRIYTWKFKILKCKTDIYVGITSKIGQHGAFCYQDRRSYCAYLPGGRVTNCSLTRDYPFKNINNNSIVEMILDLKKKELSYCIDGKHLGAAYENIDTGENIKYRMAVYMHYVSTKMELIGFDVGKTEQNSQ